MTGIFFKDSRSKSERLKQTTRMGRIALDRATKQLLRLTADSLDGRIAVLFISVQAGFQNLDAIIRAASQLAVQPVELDVDQKTVMLTFEPNWLCDSQLLLWRPTREYIEKIYQALINNLIDSSFSSIQQIQVGLSDLYNDQLGISESTARMIADSENTNFLLTFKQYGADVDNGGLISVVGAERLTWATDSTGAAQLTDKPSDLVDYVVDQDDLVDLDPTKIMIDFPASTIGG